jgi:Na+/proline symporter
VNALDYAVLVCLLVGIAFYGIWQTRERRSLAGYLKGVGQTHWLTIGLSVMATQASAITFLSTPGQGYESGLGFVQNYFGAPFALIVVSAAFLPLYRKLGVYTAYEYLGRRFDSKTRLLGAGLFLLQRGLGAGITIYAPAIVLSTVLGWRLDATIVCSGLLVIIYTVSGGSDAVNLTQKYQIGVIFVGMIAAFFFLLARLPDGLGFGGALALAGRFHKLQAVDFSLDVNRRYTLWTGLLGGFFLALSYFGTDQSQVQRYLSGGSLRESRMGLMFNAVFKIPMQFFILLLGVLLFVFYQFERPPVFFNQVAWSRQAAGPGGGELKAIEAGFGSARTEEADRLREWLVARRSGNRSAEDAALNLAQAAHERAEAARSGARTALRAADPKTAAGDADYVFIAFILRFLPHGLIGLLIAAFFAAAFSSKAAELNALGSTTTVDIYRHIVRREAVDAHYVGASKLFTAFWGAVAIAFALFANLTENLIQAVNIVGSLFYGGVLGIFLVAFFLKWVGGTAVFWAAIAGQLLVIVLYRTLDISYLWYNLIGCAVCVILSVAIEGALALGGKKGQPTPP